MDKRIGFIGIIIEDYNQTEKVNQLIGQFRGLVIGRIDVPNQEQDITVLGLIIECTNDEAGAMTGKLGNMKGVTVKCVLTTTRER